MRGQNDFSEVRPGLNLLHLDEQQQQQERRHQDQRFPRGGGQDGGTAGVVAVGGSGGSEQASIAALQLQVDKLQRFFDSSTRGVGASSPAPLPPSFGFVPGGGGGGGGAPPSSRFADDLSFAEDRLAALSWDDADPLPTARTVGGDGGGGNVDSGALAQQMFQQQQQQRQQQQQVGERGFPGDSMGNDAHGRWAGADSSWAAAPSPLSGLGSLTLASAVSQAEFSEWRRATPGLLT
ncbi:unnamed protein product [Scytosiphon promiscuus]